MTHSHAFFERTGDTYRPTSLAISFWSKQALHGPPVCGLLAKELERQYLEDGFVPARFSVDLHRPVPAVPLSVQTRIIQDANRIRAASAVIIARDAPVARANIVFLKKSEQPPGRIWTQDRIPPVPPLERFPDPSRPLFGSDGHPDGWSTSMRDHQDASRKRTWLRRIQLVEGEDPTPFVVAAILGEQASFVTNWGTAGMGYINVDVSMTFARLPISTEMGIEAENHFSADGIAAGTATLYDAAGPIATSTVSALANAQRQVDLRSKTAAGTGSST